MLGGPARRGAQKGWVRRTIAAGVVVGGAMALASGGAEADDCLLMPFSPCPGAPAPTTTSTTSTTSTTAAPRPAPTMTAAQAATHLLALVNRERTERGLPSLDPRNDVGSIAMRWSVAMAGRGDLSHNDEYFSADTRRSLDARALGENVARAVDVESAHRALMASEHHRANILDERFTVAGFGAELANGSWWFTEDFLQPAARTAPRTTPTASPRGEPEALGGPAPDVRAASGRGAVLASVTPTSTAPVVADGATSFHFGRTDALQRGLPDRSRSDRRQAAALSVLAVLVVGTLALRRWAVQKVRHAKRARRTIAAIEARTGPTIEDDGITEGGRHQLAVISVWARTLEDRWATMSAGDKRVAMQVIERNAEAALANMAVA